MLRHYIKMAMRHLLKNKIQNLISIVGLSVGILCFSICLYCSRFISEVDSCFSNKELIADINLCTTRGDLYSGIPATTIEELRKLRFDEVQDFTFTVYPRERSYNVEIKEGKELPYDHLMTMEVDSLFRKVFTPRILQGSWEVASNTPNAIIAKVILVALLSVWVSSLFHDAVNKLVWCLIFGVLCKELGFLDEDALGKAHATGIVMPIITLSIFTNLASATPEMVGGMVVPLLVCVVIGTVAFSVVSILVGKIFGYSWQMSMAIGSSCLFGFPGTVIISNEVSESTGANAEERAAINAQIMPKMLVAGMVTVSITSVLVAGVMCEWL